MWETQQEAENGILKAPNLDVAPKQRWSHQRGRKRVQASVHFIKRVLDCHNRKCVLQELYFCIFFYFHCTKVGNGYKKNANSLLRTCLYRNRNLSNHANDAVYHCSFLQCFNLLSCIYRLFSEATVFVLQHIRLLHVSHHIYCFHNQSSGSKQVITCVFSFGMYFIHGKSDFFFWLIKSTAIQRSLVTPVLDQFSCGD